MTNTAIRYTPEFKQTLIDLHEKGHSFKELHEEYGPSLDTIRKWVQAATVIAIDHQGTAVTNEQFKQLQKENRRLREELDILKRAAVLLAKRWIYSFLGRQANK
ncbi:transposase [Lacticaseibacillus paracasei]|uniref:transposase n=1 Tax=Lacticaseibacillus paracasei TaxID=1597 RepID=UPI001CDC8803|nr:transposase [Lacticaseibacillus paracasei]